MPNRPSTRHCAEEREAVKALWCLKIFDSSVEGSYETLSSNAAIFKGASERWAGAAIE